MRKDLEKNRIERIGAIGRNSLGSLMEVVEYKSAKNITVKFLEHGNLVPTQWKLFSIGLVKNPYDRSVQGMGYLGEGDYKATEGKKETRKYIYWRLMFQRCYDVKYHKKQPTYLNCLVDSDWHNFQNFAKWYDENYYEIEGETMCLDKDILIKGNKVYSSETCIFVPHCINNLFVKNNANRGNLPIGVYYHKGIKKYIAKCNNITIKKQYSKCFDTPEEAFKSYKTFKEDIIKKVAEEYRNKIPKKLYEAMIVYKVEMND